MATLADLLRQTGYSQDGELSAPAPTGPSMTSILQQHIASLPQTTQQNLAKQRQDIDAALQMTPQGIQVGNQQAFNNVMSEVPNIAALTAWHGTPHTINGAFDISKVGTGEGAQAYGHGMYFAENPEVAGQYRTALSNIEMSAKGKPLKELGIDERVATHSPGIFENPLDYGLAEYNKSLKTQLLDYPELKNDPNYPKELFDQRMEYLKSWGKGTKEEKAAQAMQNFVKKNGYPDVNVSGNLYKVDIPDEHIPHMLDWDKPVPEDLRKNISKVALEDFGNGATGTSGEHLYKEIVFEMRQKGSNNPEADASAWLAKQGVPGIRYLDEGSRRKPYAVAISTKKGPYAESNFSTKEQAEQYIKEKQAEGFKTELKNIGTSNFVVFDPSTVKILEENGKPLTRKELIEKQVKELKD